MNPATDFPPTYEISPRFRRRVEERIARLESDAAGDESNLRMLQHADHRVRQERLVSVQLAEAMRMRLFLERAAGSRG
jgi:hypothetical protein